MLSPAVLRAMCVFENTSGVPEDRFVNTFHFYDANNVAPGDFGTIATRLISLYNDPITNGNPVCYYLSNHLDRGANKAQIRVYDLGTSEPREPHVTPFTLGGASNSSVNLPNEVCITVSYFAQRSLPRQRGRIYVGPLNGSAMEDTGGDARVTPQCRSDLAAAFKRLGAFEDALAWAVFSRKDNEARGPIGGGWVDNAFDTQRRRGRDASVRTSWVR